MKSYKNFLTEADTSDAANAEMTIVYAYNISKGHAHKDALDLGQIEESKWNALKKNKTKFNSLMATGKGVTKNLGNVGNHMVHAGSSSATNNYPLGTDTTSKTDLYGTSPQHQFSLKKAGESGSGAQLMSAKSGEASGVLNFAMQHYEQNGGSKKLANSAEAKSAFGILRKKMLATATNKMYVYVGEAKKDFQSFWTSKDNPRWKVIAGAVKGLQVDKEGYINDKHYNKRVASFKAKGKVTLKKISDAHIVDHLDAELSLLGARPKRMKDELKYLMKSSKDNKSFIKMPTAKEIKSAEEEFLSNKKIKIGKKTTLSAKHLEKVAKADKTPDVLKQQIIDVINVSLKAKDWQEELSNFFNDNEELKQWIVYEAASGLGKFTGKTSKGGIWKSKPVAVANTMLVFKDDGSIRKESIPDYAKSHTDLVDTLSISYKGSGTARYIKMGISSGVEYTNPSMMTEEVSNTLEDIINTELINYHGAMYQLDEGFLDSVKGLYKSAKEKAQAFVDKAQELLKMLYEKIIEKFINKIIEWAEKGLTYLMEILGFEVGGTVSMSTPSW
mgnify:CR=1 FL=1